MRKYGNFFRAADCPADSWSNRIHTVDIRLISGNTPAHSDMVMWHADDTVESAALQLWNTLFSVPQISVKIGSLPQEHREMINYYISFWTEHRDLLLNGILHPSHPELLYPLVTAVDGDKTLCASYGDKLVCFPQGACRTFIAVNADRSPNLIVDTGKKRVCGKVTVRDCRGRLYSEARVDLCGFERIAVPPSGTMSLVVE